MFAEYVLYKKHDNRFHCHIKRDWNLLFLFKLLENGVCTVNANRVAINATVIHDVIKGGE
jgi:hypothetical protein